MLAYCKVQPQSRHASCSTGADRTKENKTKPTENKQELQNILTIAKMTKKIELGKTKENKNIKQNEREKDNMTNRKIKNTEKMGRKMILKGKESKI